MLSTFQRSFSLSPVQNILSKRAMSSFPVTATITAKLKDALNPSHLEVINESYMHNV